MTRRGVTQLRANFTMYSRICQDLLFVLADSNIVEKERTDRQSSSKKRVDILLGVDLTLLSAKGQIQRAIIIAGDSDFIPAVEVAKNEGVSVILYHGNSYHRDLWQSADERFLIDQATLDSVRRNPGV